VGCVNRLYERGFIEDPVNKTKSVIFTEGGLRESERLFNRHFVIPERTENCFNGFLTRDTDMYLTCPVVYKGFWFVQCVGSRTDGMPTVDQSDMRGLGTA
jgi:hypothetical protein